MVATRRETIAEFAARNRDGLWELIDGEPVEKPLSTYESSWIAGELFGHLYGHVNQHALGRAFLPDTGYVIFPGRETVVAPDVSFVRFERFPALTQSFIPIPPDLAVEVLSPPDRLADALAKAAMYLEAGVPLVWLIDPIRRTALIFRQATVPVSIDEHGVLDGEDILPGFTLPLATLFA
ncbi:MAG: Uma2 family endonuclease [Thermomicrobiales bacterium]